MDIKIKKKELSEVMQELSNVLAGKYEEIVEKITSFSNEYLNDEYKNLCIQAAKILFTNNEDKVKKGKSFSWAAGIVHAVGNVNNLFDAKKTLNLPNKYTYWYSR